jgi:serine/threonine-protein kinase
MSLKNGEIVADYSVVGWLGSGPLGDIYRATRLGSTDDVALKVPSITTSQDRTFCMRFQKEGAYALTVSHPNLVRLHGLGESEGQVWAARDYVDGHSAADLLARYPGGIPERELCTIVGAIADALDHLHQRGYWHCDVKPTNIWIADCKDGQQRILLSDFCISGRLAINAPTAETLAYIGPERLSEFSDYRIDQYALAANAFHLLTGFPPALFACEKSLPSDRRPKLVHLDRVLMKALAKNPDERFGSCAEFAAELARAAGQRH